MPEILEKLRPDRDLQCYFLRPSAIAALSGTSSSGFTLSGTWRQQFDWAVVEWNRDNVFDHPSFRNLPDGDLSGLTLTYDETRSNCIPVDSNLFPTVDWPSLRIWADHDGREDIYFVHLQDYAVPVDGSYQQASAELTLSGTATDGDLVGFSFLDEHYAYRMRSVDIVENALQAMVEAITSSTTLTATRDGNKLILTLKPPVPDPNDPTNSNRNYLHGANGNRVGLYTYVTGSTEQWDVSSRQFSGGTSPSKWRVTLPFGSLMGSVSLPGGAPVPVPVNNVRKLRWTYAADLQTGAYVRSEFQVVVSNWNVSGSGRTYSVAGPGSRRFNDPDSELVYSGKWQTNPGAGDLELDHYYGGTVHFTSTLGETVRCNYTSAQAHNIYLGTRRVNLGPKVTVAVDGQPPKTLDLSVPREDILVREFLGQAGPGDHTILATLSSQGTFYFDFIELAVPTTSLPNKQIEEQFTLATDWDTDHSLALAPERTAWIMDSLGFQGRPNHYVGALWFYELVRPRHVYASGTITFAGKPDTSSGRTEVSIGRTGEVALTTISHLNLIGDTPETLAKCFELQINAGSNAVWAQASGADLRIFSRSMGLDGNNITIAVSPSPQNFTSGNSLQGGTTGEQYPDDIVQRDGWVTDLQATPRLNRAVRDWSRSFFKALNSYGHTSVAAAFSTELQHGDPSPEAGIGQRYLSGNPVLVNTPALQTNFSPQSLAFWQQVYADIAGIQMEAGLKPYLQFGEVQWWYFPELAGKAPAGMTFYDAYTKSAFRARYGRDMSAILDNTQNPASLPDEAVFLPQLIGQHTAQIMTYVKASFPDCQFEVLYPPDVNNYALNKVINYPVEEWTPAKLTCLKTENFSYTFDLNLDLAKQSMDTGAALAFPPSKRSHLVGVESSYTAWLKEARMAESGAFESVVLFALDQFCLIGYSLPLSVGLRRSVQMG